MARVVKRKKVCKPVRWKIGEKPRGKWDAGPPSITVRGYIEGRETPVAKGTLKPHTRPGPDDVAELVAYSVAWSSVSAGSRRCGYGTKLYEMMRDIACQDGVKLQSDRERTEFSDGFWKKQAKKGRARCVEPIDWDQRDNDLLPEDATCGWYEMKETCPRDRSLAAIKKAKARLKKKRKKR
jgi:hypothetical protein